MCRRLHWATFLYLFLVLFESILSAGTFADDLNGLLPPISADHSTMIAEIRRAFRSRNLSFACKKTDELIAQEPTNFEGYFWRGFLELQRRDNPNAVRFLRKAQPLDSNSYVLRLLAVSYYFLDQFKLFTETMQEAMRKQPLDFSPYYYLGRYYASKDAPDFSRAAGYFQEALYRKPDHYASHYYLGYCRETERQLKEAEREYRQSMQLAEAGGNEYGLPYQGMARVQLLENKPADARQFAIQAVQFSENDAESHVVLARAYGALGQVMKAVPEWERATILDPANAAPYYHLYRIYSAMGDRERAGWAITRYNKLMAIYGK
jgi:tetratricopeptide (TPR) repeat protein